MSVDLSDLSHSYPFLHLSRKFGVPYSEVLRASSWVDTWAPPSATPKIVRDVLGRYSCLQPDAAGAVVAVCRAPWRWDMAQSQERGL